MAFQFLVAKQFTRTGLVRLISFTEKFKENTLGYFPIAQGRCFELSKKKPTKYPAGLCHRHLPAPERNDLCSSQQTQRGHAVWQRPRTVARKRPV